MSRRTPPTPPHPVVRCAVYTRKSSEEGLEQEFNSLDAQRESAEAYIASQKGEGWVCLPERYDDGGYTGGNIERPAVQRLLADIEAGRIDCVVVYKVDRLSRSLMDFARMMETFDKHKVSFVSVTQQFNTTQSMGRLTLNILLSFAQFEREIISERTRDKIAAARRKGKWAGGKPILGYDLVDSKLVVNESEACRVREIFALYVRLESIGRTVEALRERGWRAKQWTTRDERPVGGQEITKAYLHRLLTNVAYLGKVRYHEQVFDGEHAAIVDADLWRRAQAILTENGRTGGTEVMNKHGALLKGVLRCGACDKPMTHVFTEKPGGKLYRYYTCFTAQSRGYHACPSKSLPAQQIEDFVVERIKALGRDRELVTMILDHAQSQDRERVEVLEGELATIEREMKWLASETRHLAGANGAGTERLAEVTDRTSTVEARAREVREEMDTINRRLIGRDQVEAGASAFDPLWHSLSTRERTSLVRLIVRRVEYNGGKGEISMTFHPETEWLAVEVAR
ncbi:MAG: recombinase family protein [Deltaproteobacteria bacterium]|nr:recombinase family protein [Deltaproteobacteria bacterium]